MVWKKCPRTRDTRLTGCSRVTRNTRLTSGTRVTRDTRLTGGSRPRP